MDVADLQARLRRFAAERDWERYHAPKNLAMALAVEAAELAEIFQWSTEEESRRAHLDVRTHERIADEVAAVLLFLLQVADKCGVDIEAAARRKLEKNAVKHPVPERGAD
jgi:NTP pyrophosphatase (non-canonical NTP hydrolase)